jgi:hypothetical protein
MDRLTSLQERFESSDFGRIAISALLIATILGIVVWNLPGGVLQARLIPVARPYFQAAGLDQGWGVFAPDPRETTNDFYARLDYPDGTETTWRYPLGNPEVATYRTFRWQKWSEHVAIDVRSLLPPAAQWLVRTQVLRGQHPIEVALVQRWATTPPPGNKTPLQWQEDTLYTWTASSVPRFGL